jgi:hypothetical protein
MTCRLNVTRDNRVFAISDPRIGAWKQGRFPRHRTEALEPPLPAGHGENSNRAIALQFN